MLPLLFPQVIARSRRPAVLHWAAAGHPGFEVVLAVGRPAEVAGTGVDDVVRQPEPLKDRLLDPQDVLVQRVALLRRAEREHLNLGELVDAIQAARVPAWRARFGAEAVR